jgi:thiol-disulfide isomerase/thioredoxin
VQIGVKQIAAQEAVALSVDDACPACSVNFSADVAAANATSQASFDTAASNMTAPTAPVARAAVTHDVTVLFYWQPNCPHCDSMRPSIEKLNGSYPSVHFVFVNTLESPQSAIAHGVTGTPTTIVFNDGKEVSRYTGEFDVIALQQRLELLAT